MSCNDFNCFLDLDSEDDLGFLVYIELQYWLFLGGDSSGWQLDVWLSYEWVQANFEFFNFYCNLEFFWDWSLVNVQGQGSVLEVEE